MSGLEHATPDSVDDALALLTPQAAAIAGGTDLVGRMKEGLARPGRLVDLKHVAELEGFRAGPEGLTLGALARLADLAAGAEVARGWAALAQACRLSASPPLRNMATIGGNLVQSSRCWYYRGPFACLLKGGDVCYARDGENREHALFGYEDDGCVHVYPSDPAVALVALGARVTLRDAAGAHEWPVEDLFHVPTRADRRTNTLPAGTLITAVHLPPAGPRSVYLKAMDRAAWTFALASVAVALAVEDGVVRRPRIVLGGVAGVPWRATAAETVLDGQALADVTGDVIAHAAVAATDGARPLADNGYKVPLVQGLVRQALRAVL